MNVTKIINHYSNLGRSVLSNECQKMLGIFGIKLSSGQISVFSG